MSSRADDPLAGVLAPDRVFYAEGVLLSAADFEAEQAYHRGRLARALAALHGSGTVAGLRVIWQAARPAEVGPPAPPRACSPCDGRDTPAPWMQWCSRCPWPVRSRSTCSRGYRSRFERCSACRRRAPRAPS